MESDISENNYSSDEILKGHIESIHIDYKDDDFATSSMDQMSNIFTMTWKQEYKNWYKYWYKLITENNIDVSNVINRNRKIRIYIIKCVDKS